MEFSRQECWSRLLFLPPEDLLHPGIELASLASSALAGKFFTSWATKEAPGSLWGWAKLTHVKQKTTTKTLNKGLVHSKHSINISCYFLGPGTVLCFLYVMLLNCSNDLDITYGRWLLQSPSFLYYSGFGILLPFFNSWGNLGKGYTIFLCVYTDIFFKLCIFLTKDFAPINWVAILLLPFILSIEILPNCIDTKEDKALFVPLLKSANNPVSDSADVLVLVCCILATIRILSTVLLTTPPKKEKNPLS